MVGGQAEGMMGNGEMVVRRRTGGLRLPDRPSVDGYRSYGEPFPTTSQSGFRPGLPTEVRALNEFLVSREW